MRNELPGEIEVHELPGGALYRLPPRQLGSVRFSIGIPLILFGLFFSGFSLFWMGAVLFGAGFQPVQLVFALIGIPFVLAGLVPIAIAFALISGRCEIEITGQGLRAVERVGPFYWTWRRPLDVIRRLELTTTSGRINGHRQTGLDNLAAIKVECRNRRHVLLAPAYARTLLAPLADDLARRCNESEHARFAGIDPIEVVEKHIAADGHEFEELPDQPNNSVVDVETHGNGVTFHVPPAGILRGSKGLIFVSLVWIGFMVVFTTFMIFVAQDVPLVVAGVISLFWLAGIGMLLGAINMGRRRAVLAVIDDQLMMLQTGLFRNKRWEWSRDDIEDICSGPSGMTVNDMPIMELQVHPREGKKVGILAGRGHDELRWLATRLRHALALPRPEGQAAEDCSDDAHE